MKDENACIDVSMTLEEVFDVVTNIPTPFYCLHEFDAIYVESYEIENDKIKLKNEFTERLLNMQDVEIFLEVPIKYLISSIKLLQKKEDYV